MHDRRRFGPSTRLIIFVPDEPKEEVELTKDEIVLGRALHCDIVLAHVSVSREHAGLRYEGGTYFAKDLGSTNGIRVNGKKVTGVHLKDGDTLQVGEVLCKFVMGGKKKVVSEDSKGVRVVRRDSSAFSLLQDRLASRKRRKGSRLPLVIGGVLMLGVVVLVLAGRGGRGTGEGPVAPRPVGSVAMPVTDRGATPMPTSDAALLAATSGDSRDVGVAPVATAGVPATIADAAEANRRRKLVIEAFEKAQEAVAAFKKAAAAARSIDEVERALDQAKEVHESLAAVVRLDPNHRAARRAAADAEELEARLEQRRKDLIAARRARIADLYSVARSQLVARNYGAALASFKKVLALDPRHQGALRGRDQAQAELARMAARKKARSQARALLADAQASIQQAEGAATAGRPATALKNLQEALDKLDQVQQLDLGTTAEERSQAAGMQRAVKDRMSQLEGALSKVRTEARDLFGKGVTYESLGRVDKAEEMWRKVLEIVPDPEDEYHQKARRKLARLGVTVD